MKPMHDIDVIYAAERLFMKNGTSGIMRRTQQNGHVPSATWHLFINVIWRCTLMNAKKWKRNTNRYVYEIHGDIIITTSSWTYGSSLPGWSCRKKPAMCTWNGVYQKSGKVYRVKVRILVDDFWIIVFYNSKQKIYFQSLLQKSPRRKTIWTIIGTRKMDSSWTTSCPISKTTASLRTQWRSIIPTFATDFRKTRM